MAKRMSDAMAAAPSKKGRGILAEQDRTPRRTAEHVKMQLLNPAKRYNDPVHHIIAMDSLCQRIIDTPEYQRLMHLKQLGTCQFVFRGAVHTRLEHSLGVAHLSEKLAQSLHANQPELGLTPLDILCVKVAGLCHDLGHGPFSHVYDGEFIPMARPDIKWKHEEGSILMLRYLLEKNGINPAEFGVGQQDMLFIEEIIRGEEEKGDKGCTRRGREKEKWFLYDIVNNIRSGLDVDKLDYFQRDMHYANVSLASTASFERFIAEARVIPAKPIEDYSSTTKEPSLFSMVKTGTAPAPAPPPPLAGPLELMACYPEKMADAAMDFFSCRFRMHKTVYTHRTVKQVEFMICDAMLEADPHLRIKGDATPAHPDGLYKMSECIDHASALARLNDNVIELIKHDPRPELQKARDILDRLEKRKLYSCLGNSQFMRASSTHKMSEEQILHAICAITQELASGTYVHSDNIADADEDGLSASQSQFSLSQSLSQSSTSGANGGRNIYVEVQPEDLIVEKTHVHHGLKEHDPVSRMRFFKKQYDPAVGQVGFKVSVDAYDLPSVLERMTVRLFCRRPERRTARTARFAFDIWCSRMSLNPPQPSSNTQDDDGKEES